MKLKLNINNREFLCEYFTVHNLSNIQDLIDTLENLIVKSQGFRFLITLDDINQSTYTSMHSVINYDLDGEDWIDNENLNIENKFIIRKLGFKHNLKEVEFEDIFNKILFLNEDSKKEFMNANKNLLSIIDKKVYLLKIPVEQSYESIFAFPNGYFDCDLSPFENYYLSKYMSEKYDYHLIGMGASYISFLKGIKFKNDKIDELVKFLMKLYVEENDEELSIFLKQTIFNQKILTLKYSE